MEKSKKELLEDMEALISQLQYAVKRKDIGLIKTMSGHIYGRAKEVIEVGKEQVSK